MASKATSAYPVSPPRRNLKRSASTTSLASLPTPPRTYRRRGRGRSRGSCDSDSDSDDAGRRHHTPEIPTEDEAGRAGRVEPQRKKRRVALAQDKDDEEAFWLGGSAGNRDDDEKQEQESGQSDEDDGGKSSKSAAATLKRQAPLLYRKLQASASSTSSQTEQGLLSPPASHRKPTTVKSLEVASKPTLSAIDELPVTPRKPKAKKASPPTLKAKAFVDSPSNPFLETPVDPRLVLSSDSEGEDAGPSKEKEVPEYDKPTVTYVFRGVRRVYQNPMFDHAKGRPVTPPPNSKLPVDDPLYSPDPTCQPRLLFPEAHKKRIKVRAAKAAVAEKTKVVKKKKAVVVDSDSDDGRHAESSVTKISQPKFVPKAKAKKAAPPAAEDDLFA